jgi:hypothetical protein
MLDRPGRPARLLLSSHDNITIKDLSICVDKNATKKHTKRLSGSRRSKVLHLIEPLGYLGLFSLAAAAGRLPTLQGDNSIGGSLLGMR